MGGSQSNAIDFAARMRDQGHQVMVCAPPGPLVDRVRHRRLPFTPFEPHAPHVSLRASRELLRVARGFRADLVHGYEYYPSMEGWLGPTLQGDIPSVSTVLTMWLPLLPSRMPLVVGTESLAAVARARRRGPVRCIEPPVDVDHDAVDAPGVKPERFRDTWGIDPGVHTLVLVSRLEQDLKVDGIERAIEAVPLLETDLPVQLVIVGDGAARPDLDRRAMAVNERVGRRSVVLTGELPDPRSAYAAADLVLGMGSSILRGMSFGKPAIVVGRKGFSEPIGPDTLPRFLYDGFIGVGLAGDALSGAELIDALRDLQDGAGPVRTGDPGARRLAGQIATILGSRQEAERRGEFALQTVRTRYSLEVLTDALLEVYEEALRSPMPRAEILADSAVTWSRKTAGRTKSKTLRVLAAAGNLRVGAPRRSDRVHLPGASGLRDRFDGAAHPAAVGIAHRPAVEPEGLQREQGPAREVDQRLGQADRRQP
ncbi:MAG: glycosyltransferase [Propionibacteriales bacterium]|nr:glycosyltransferase [Propionibacteriales bacterium]